MCDIFSFFEVKVHTCSFGKEKPTDQSFSLQKIFLLYDDRIEIKCKSRLLLKPGPGPRSHTLKNLDPEKSRPRKTWTLKSLDPKKYRVNIGLKCMSDFRELCFLKIMRNV